MEEANSKLKNEIHIGIGKMLTCAKCSLEITTPIRMSPCKHSFCKECVIDSTRPLTVLRSPRCLECLMEIIDVEYDDLLNLVIQMRRDLKSKESCLENLSAENARLTEKNQTQSQIITRLLPAEISQFQQGIKKKDQNPPTMITAAEEPKKPYEPLAGKKPFEQQQQKQQPQQQLVKQKKADPSCGKKKKEKKHCPAFSADPPSKRIPVKTAEGSTVWRRARFGESNLSALQDPLLHETDEGLIIQHGGEQGGEGEEENQNLNQNKEPTSFENFLCDFENDR